MTMTELNKPLIVMHLFWWDLWHLRKNRMKPGKEPRVVREPRFSHPWSRI